MSIWGAVKSWLIEFPGHPGSGPNDPSSMSPVVKAWQPELALVRALYGGFQALYEQRTRFLPQHPKEDPQDYYIRANRPTFYNAFSRTVHALAGIVFRDPPTPEGVPAEITALYEDDIDNQGSDGPSFLRMAFQESLVTGLTGIFVDQQSLVGTGLTRADELAAGIRPYWTLVRKDDIVSFRTMLEDGETLLAQLVFYDRRQAPYGEYGVKIVERLRVYRRLPSTPAGESGDTVAPQVTEEIYEKDDKGKYQSLGTRVMPAVEEIPFAVLYAERTDFLDACPPLMDLATVNLLHYQMSSDLHHAAHIANVPFLFGVGIDEEDLQVGPNRAILAKAGDQNTTLRWVETTGASLGSTRAILSDLEEQMATLGLGMLQRKSRHSETAQKASLDKQEQDSTLAGIVTELEDGIARALYYTSVYLGLATWGKLIFTRDFQIDALAATATGYQDNSPPPAAPTLPGTTNNPKTTGV